MERERIRGENEWAEMFTPAPSVQLVQVPLAQLVPWEQADGSPQPFKPYTQEKLAELADSIRQHGVLEAIRVRPRNGKFQILAGHNRSQAARMAGLTTIPAIVEDVDDDQAALILVDSNLQHREKLLPSEKAWAYRTRLEALKRKAGRPKNNSGQVGPNFRSDEEVAQNVGESRKQVQRYIRLTYLNPLLLDLVDQEKIGMTPGVELSYLSDSTQDKLLEVMAANGIQKISGKQAKDLRNADSPEKEEIAQILGLTEKQPKPATLKFQPDMSRYPAHVVQRLQKDSVYLAKLQAALEAFTDKYLAEKGEN